MIPKRILITAAFLCYIIIGRAVDFTNYYQFKDSLLTIVGMENAGERDSILNRFWQDLKSSRQIPFAIGDSVAFLYRGNYSSISWAGDFSGWSPVSGTRLEPTDVWILERSFPSDARLDYKIVRPNNNWILDPNNPYKQMSGFGYNSELRMPDYIYPSETIRDPDAPAHHITNWTIIFSQALGYDVQYRVYTPAGYDTLSNLPVIYVTDGQEYSDSRMGSMLEVLDNLIFWGAIRPVMAVFISPVNPSNSLDNRRMNEYNLNPSFAEFVAQELVPVIDQQYKTDPRPEARVILGTSMGGLNSMFFGITRSEIFGLIAIQSPAFNQNPTIYSMVRDSVKKPLTIIMQTGVIHDTQDAARQMKGILESKGYTLQYKEVNEGHSWGNWRALLDDILIYFFGTGVTEIEQRFRIPGNGDFRLFPNFPNPFNGQTKLHFELKRDAFVKISIFDMLGRKIASFKKGKLQAGSYKMPIPESVFRRKPSGIYFYEIKFNQSIYLRGKMLYLK